RRPLHSLENMFFAMLRLTLWACCWVRGAVCAWYKKSCSLAQKTKAPTVCRGLGFSSDFLQISGQGIAFRAQPRTLSHLWHLTDEKIEYLWGLDRCWKTFLWLSLIWHIKKVP
ncbi:MAG: hypothetical protein NWQ69_01595, partial [Paracoccaceae bacterium]|nr:hypothetical protein [Paracoccaceae bacterium]